MTQKIKKLFFLVGVGSMAASGGGGTGGYVGGRLGVLYSITPGTLDLVVSAGGAIAFSGAPWRGFGMASFLLSYYASESIYIGGGAGFSSNSRAGQSSKVEIIATIGYDVIDRVKAKGSIFLEGRFLGDTKIMIGYRLLF